MYIRKINMTFTGQNVTLKQRFKTQSCLSLVSENNLILSWVRPAQFFMYAIS